MANPLKARVELMVVGNHDASEMISTMPRRPSSVSDGSATSQYVLDAGRTCARERTLESASRGSPPQQHLDHFLRNGTTFGMVSSKPQPSSARRKRVGETFQRWPSSLMTVTVFRL